MIKSTKAVEVVGNSQNRIAQGTVITGDVTGAAGFRIDGEIIGTLKTNSKVVIGKDGKIQGTLECTNADIEGAFSGTLKVDELLSLKSTAVIEGEVTTSKLSIEPGATFSATCSMGTAVQSLDSDQKGKIVKGKITKRKNAKG